jgi:hypothetical protein
MRQAILAFREPGPVWAIGVIRMSTATKGSLELGGQTIKLAGNSVAKTLKGKRGRHRLRSQSNGADVREDKRII